MTAIFTTRLQPINLRVTLLSQCAVPECARVLTTSQLLVLILKSGHWLAIGRKDSTRRIAPFGRFIIHAFLIHIHYHSAITLEVGYDRMIGFGTR